MNTYRITFIHSGGKLPQYELRANNLEHALARARKAYTLDEGFTDPADKLQLFAAQVTVEDAAYNVPYSYSVDDLRMLLGTNERDIVAGK